MPVFSFSDATILDSLERPLERLNWQVEPGSVWQVTGNSEFDLTRLGEVLVRKKFLQKGNLSFGLPKVDYSLIGFNSVYLFPRRFEMYYQKRFNQFEGENLPMVKEVLKERLEVKGQKLNKSINNSIRSLKLELLLEKKIHQLSHGEMKRFMILLELVYDSQVIILDHPFEGIDQENKLILNSFFKDLIQKGRTLVFLQKENLTAPYVEHILELKNQSAMTYYVSEWIQRPLIPNQTELQLIKPLTKSDFIFKPDYQANTSPYLKTGSFTESVLNPTSESQPNGLFEMKNLSIRYGESVIIKNLDWVVNEGEKWLVSGPNGSGKSTLLSLINGDHPQAFGEHFRWKGKPRGSGETIWDIKRNIGYMAPEMLIYLPHDQNGFQMVASGLFDTYGLFKKLKPEEHEKVKDWISYYELNNLENRSIRSMPIMEQRLILLARATLKRPELLILDEPFQGLTRKDISTLLERIRMEWVNPRQTLIFTCHDAHHAPKEMTHFLNLKSINN